jgi:histidine triad (HIT) family protein
MEECIFCRIVNGELPARKVYEDETTVAFWDARPASPIHVLIVPRRHIPTLNDIPLGDHLVSHMSDVAKKIALDLGVAQSGYRFFINVNRGGGQVIFHLHAHLVAGNDFGTLFIKAGIAIAILWRRMVYLVRRRGPRSAPERKTANLPKK